MTVRLRSSRGGSEELDVRIPPGVEDGQRIRLRGKGHPGANGGPPGDLFLICAVGSHPYFRRDGANILLDVPVTVSEATLGAKIEVPTLDGRVTLTIPAGTEGGSKLRLRGRGVPGAGGKAGDQIVTVRINPPKELTDAQRSLFESLRELEGDNPRSKLQ